MGATTSYARFVPPLKKTIAQEECPHDWYYESIPKFRTEYRTVGWFIFAETIAIKVPDGVERSRTCKRCGWKECL